MIEKVKRGKTHIAYYSFTNEDINKGRINFYNNCTKNNTKLCT